MRAREELMERLLRFVDVDGAGLVQAASTVAHEAHSGQRDKAGEPYIRHPERVAERLAPFGALHQAAGWLHDAVEDTALVLDDLRALGFPEELVHVVDHVTRRPGEVYVDFVRRAASHPVAREVKVQDVADNLRPGAPAALRRRYYRALAILVGDPDPVAARREAREASCAHCEHPDGHE